MDVTMKSDKMFEWFMIGFICLWFVTMGYAILGGLTDRAPVSKEPLPVNQGRTIPKCDKELWLRIKDGCDGDTED